MGVGSEEGWDALRSVCFQPLYRHRRETREDCVSSLATNLAWACSRTNLMSSTISVVRAGVFKDVSVLAWDVGCIYCACLFTSRDDG